MNKDVELIFKAKDETTKVVDAIANTFSRLMGVQNQLGSSGAKVNSTLDNLLSSFTRLDKTVSNLTQLRTIVGITDQLGRSMGTAEKDVARTEKRLDSLRIKLEQLNAADKPNLRSVSATEKQIDSANKKLDEQRAALVKVRQQYEQVTEAARKAGTLAGVSDPTKVNVNEALTAARGDQNVIRDSVRSINDMIDAAERLRQQVDPLAAAQDAYNKKVAEANALFRQDLINQELLIKAEQDARQELLISTKAIQDRATARANAARLATAEGRAEADAARVAEESTKRDQAAKEQNAAAAAKLRAEIDPLGEIQHRLDVELAKARDLYHANAISATELAAKEKLLAKEAQRAGEIIHAMNKAEDGKSLFGLRPYELNSLSFQINDVFTQLGSGTPVLQVLAQQGGQIFQVFQRQLLPAVEGLAAEAATLFPELAAIAAALAILGAAIKNVVDEGEAFREFNARFIASADGGLYDARKLAQVSRQLDQYGGSLADAKQSLKEFTEAGINPDALLRFGVAAQDVARVTGKDIPSAAREMANGLTHGLDALEALDKELNVLDSNQLKTIHDMYEQGKGAQANALFFDILAEKYGKAAHSLDNDFNVAMRNFGVLWNRMLDSISHSEAITNAISLLERLSAALVQVSGGVPTPKGGGPGGTIDAQIAAGQKKIEDLRKERARLLQHPNDINLGDAAGQLVKKTLLGPVLGGRPSVDVRKNKDLAADIDKQIATATTNLNNLQKKVTQVSAQGSQAIEKTRLQNLQSLTDEQLQAQKSLKTTTDSQKIFIAGEIARRKANRETTDQVVINAQVEAAKRAEAERIRDTANQKSLRSAASAAKKEDTLEASIEKRTVDLKAQADAYKDAGDAAERTAQQQYQANKQAFVAEQLAAAGVSNLKKTTPELDALIEKLKQQSAATYDVTHADDLYRAQQAELAKVDRERRDAISDLIGKEQQREILLRQLNDELNKANPDASRIDELRAGVAGLQTEIEGAIGKAEEFAKALGDERAVAALKRLRIELETNKELVAGSAEITANLVDDATQSFDDFAQAVAETGDVFGSLEKSVLSFFSTLLRQVALAKAKQVFSKLIGLDSNNGTSTVGDKIAGAVNGVTPGGALGKSPTDAASQTISNFFTKAINDTFSTGTKLYQSIGSSIGNFFTSLFKGVGGGIGGGLNGGGFFKGIGSFFAGLLHEGGTGYEASSRLADPRWFANAPRFHTGRLPGLAPDEMAAIIRKNESVLTPGQMAAMGSAGGAQVKIINAIDAGHFYSEGLNTTAGERAILNWMGANKSKVKSVLG